MNNTKESTNIDFIEIQQAQPGEQEPQRKLEATIEMGKRDEILEKIIKDSEENK